jgi:hypothetical protein
VTLEDDIRRMRETFDALCAERKVDLEADLNAGRCC